MGRSLWLFVQIKLLLFIDIFILNHLTGGGGGILYCEGGVWTLGELRGCQGGALLELYPTLQFQWQGGLVAQICSPTCRIFSRQRHGLTDAVGVFIAGEDVPNAYPFTASLGRSNSIQYEQENTVDRKEDGIDVLGSQGNIDKWVCCTYEEEYPSNGENDRENDCDEKVAEM